jgi:hypothetical protein
MTTPPRIVGFMESYAIPSSTRRYVPTIATQIVREHELENRHVREGAARRAACRTGSHPARCKRTPKMIPVTSPKTISRFMRHTSVQHSGRDDADDEEHR